MGCNHDWRFFGHSKTGSRSGGVRGARRYVVSKCQRHTEHPVITPGCKDCEFERLLRVEFILKAAAFRGILAEDALEALRVYEEAAGPDRETGEFKRPEKGARCEDRS